jgi:hypothetical protein
MFNDGVLSLGGHNLKKLLDASGERIISPGLLTFGGGLRPLTSNMPIT